MLLLLYQQPSSVFLVFQNCILQNSDFSEALYELFNSTKQLSAHIHKSKNIFIPILILRRLPEFRVEIVFML